MAYPTRPDRSPAYPSNYSTHPHSPSGSISPYLNTDYWEAWFITYERLLDQLQPKIGSRVTTNRKA
ncbi:MAG: hypothetical protein VKK42_12830 [Lyngbya sp.]|nr:hypothetical protein [Lyngbya sp.]